MSACLPLHCTVPAAAAGRLHREMARGDGRRQQVVLGAATADDLQPGRAAAPAPDGRADSAEAHPHWPAGVTARLVRQTRLVRTGGAVVRLQFDHGRLRTASAHARVCDLRFEWVAGMPAAMVALAQRWSVRFGLGLEPCSLHERALALAAGTTPTPVRRARQPVYSRRADARTALLAVFDECFDQVVRNAAALQGGVAERRVEHVHQLRVGIRRLRSALRSFDGCMPALPDGLEESLCRLFAALGTLRDGDVLDAGVAADLARAGAPALRLVPPSRNVDALQLLASTESRHCLIAWAGWRAALEAEDEAADLQIARHATRRLRRWHQRIVQDAALFDLMDEPAVHALRKRIKRQRYATEFFGPLLARREVGRYLDVLADVQERMGALNDLYVARDSYQALVQDDPAAWFALGWLAARIAENRADLRPILQRLCKRPPPAA